MSRHVYRASFARFTVMRDTIKYEADCSFCSTPARFEYWVDNDDDGPEPIMGAFCGADCCRTYHGVSRKWGEL